MCIMHARTKVEGIGSRACLPVSMDVYLQLHIGISTRRIIVLELVLLALEPYAYTYAYY